MSRFAGRKHSPETRAKIAASMRGRSIPPEVRAKISAAVGRGARRYNWKGGRHISSAGYVSIRVDGKYALEHRHVMELKIGRGLLPGESVHHLNGDRTDNRPENLELWERPQPTGIRAADAKHCPTCTCGQH